MSTQINGNKANGASGGISPKITFYTNHACPWAQRAQITLKALGLSYEEVIIPLDRPREQWYLEINPRGLVPSVKISNGILHDEIVTESAIVSTFLADSYPSSAFWPPSHESPTSALTRARITFFVDTWFSKVSSLSYPIMRAEGSEWDEKARELVKAVEKEIEPLLEGAAPFFGGSTVITLAEALTAPFVIRLQTFSEAGYLPSSLLKDLKALPNYSKWSEALSTEKSVTLNYDGPSIAKLTAQKMNLKGK
ncbi:MAG: hypothetical protein Q9191_002588 [Dirinaria sp. TL-2023a]